MGNCLTRRPKKTTSDIAPYLLGKSAAATAATTVRLYSSSSSAAAATGTFTCYYLRFALLFKNVSLDVIPSEAHDQPTLQIGSETISGSRDTLLRFVDEKFPRPPLVAGTNVREEFGETTPLAVRVVVLQHRSMAWHVRRMVRWASDLATRKGRGSADPAAGTQKMELTKFWNGYSQLLEVLLEHAQMEERVLFPLFESADRGLCKAANGEHARDLPIMNGIKEDIKCIGAMDTSCPDYREALCNLSARLKSLQENCKGHFLEEERDLLPLLEAMELSREQQVKVLEQCFDTMQGTHSRLFKFLMEGLAPREAMQYLDLILSCKGEEWAVSLLRRIVD